MRSATEHAGLAIAALALFFFVFLGGEYFFDSTMALLVDPDQVVIAQSFILGASAVGFVLYPQIERLDFGKERLSPLYR